MNVSNSTNVLGNVASKSNARQASLGLAVLSAIAAFSAPIASATVFTWDGGTNTSPNLTLAENWTGDVAPAPASSGNSLIFAGVTNLSPLADAAYTVGKLQFNTTGFDLGGSALTITSNGTNTGLSAAATTGIYVNSTSNLIATVNNPITTSALTMYADVGGTAASANTVTLNLNGSITSGAATGKLGLGRLVLRGTNNFEGGAFELRNGILGIGAAGAGGAAGQTIAHNTGNTVVIYADGATRTIASNFLFGDAGGTPGTAAAPRITRFGLQIGTGDGAAFPDVTSSYDLIFSGGFSAVNTASFHRFDVRTSTTATFNGNFSGGNNLTLSKVGAGVLRLNGNNSALPTLDVIAGVTVAGTDTALGQTIFSGSIDGGTGTIAAPTAATRNIASSLVLSGPTVSGSIIAKPLGIGATGFTGAMNFNGPITLQGLNPTTSNQASLKPISVASGTVATFNSAVVESGGVFGIQKAGTGNLVLAGNNTYTGRTFLVDGPLTILGTNQSSFMVGGGTLEGSGSVTNLHVFDENTLTGTSAIAAGVLSPGTASTAGTITATVSALLGGAAGYHFSVESPTLTDLLVVTGPLNVTATSANPFNITVDGAGFDPNVSSVYTLATSTGVFGFDAAAFAVTSVVPVAGAFSVDHIGNSLVLSYVVPEPASLAAFGIAGVLLRRRRV